MNRSFLLLFLFPCATVLAVVPESRAFAQASDVTCMVRPAGTPPAVAIRLAIPTKNLPLMLERGFLVKACDGEELQLPALHEDACRLAQVAPLQVQALFEEKFGVKPAELCALTRIDAGE